MMAPESMKPIDIAALVIRGSEAFFSACLKSIVLSFSPFALAVIMQSSVRVSNIVALVKRRQPPYMKRVRVKVGKKRCHNLLVMSANMFGGGLSAEKEEVPPLGNQPRRKLKTNNKIIPSQNEGTEQVVREDNTVKLSTMLPLL